MGWGGGRNRSWERSGGVGTGRTGAERGVGGGSVVGGGGGSRCRSCGRDGTAVRFGAVKGSALPAGFAMAVEGGMKCVKFLVFIFNFIFWVSAGRGEGGL